MPDTVLPHVLHLKGGSNFRDLGGYTTADGRTVRRNAVFRSAHLGGLTDEDRSALGKLGVRTIVDLRGVNESAEVGYAVDVRAFVALGDLSPEDVDVQVVSGRTGLDDLLTDTEVCSMALAEGYEGGRFRYDASVPLERSGPFGYTVRVVPRNTSLSSVAELGLVALPAD